MAKRIRVWAALLLVVAFVGSMPSAYGDTHTFNDSTTDETSFAGIRWVTVQNGWWTGRNWHNNLKIVTRIGNLPPPPAGGPKTILFIDTKPRNAGPEYRVRIIQDVGLFRVNRWSDHGTYVPSTCGPGGVGYNAWYGQSGGHYNRVIASIKRACIGGAGKIRVAVHTMVGNRPNQQDWAKARKTFYPWVHRCRDVRCP